MKGRQIPYSADEMAFILSVSRWDRTEAHAAFCQKYQRDDVSLRNFSALCKRNGWLTGRTGRFAKGETPHNKGKPCEPGMGGRHPNARKTQFKKGSKPHNTNYLGHERVDPKDGYVYVRVAEPNPHAGYWRRYVLKHVHEWEKANGPIPEGHCLKCLSGEKTDCSPSNWALIPRALLPRLAGGNRYRPVLAFDDAAPEVRSVVLAVAKLEHSAREARKSRRAA